MMKSKPSLNIESKELQEIYAINKAEGVPEFKTFLAGEWASGEEWLNVRTPIDLSIFAKVSRTTQEQIERVLDVSCKKGKWAIRDIPGEKRLELYERAAFFAFGGEGFN
jgi:glyceraldehyde-3-phosphate dehydrogenase [NAD(P)+]